MLAGALRQRTRPLTTRNSPHGNRVGTTASVVRAARVPEGQEIAVRRGACFTAIECKAAFTSCDVCQCALE